MRVKPMPQVEVRPDIVALGLGLDIVTPEMMAKPGSQRLSYNYESSIDGGLRRVGGIERFDGRPEPDRASFSVLLMDADPVNASLGDTLTGATSAATGRIIWISGRRIAVSRVTGVFEAGEAASTAGGAVGTIQEAPAEISAFEDNRVAALAASDLRSSIGQVPGIGPVRGIEILGSTVYAWRDSDPGLGPQVLRVFKATSSGWVQVQLLFEVGFSSGSAAYAEGSNITQGSVSAPVRRVVLESGSWSSGTAAGRLIVGAATGGGLAAGVAGGGGACTLTGPATQIELQPGGTVRTDVSNLTASPSTRRIYGCDGVNREFELGADDIYVPLNTGMPAGLRARAVREHKQHVFFGFNGSVQHSSLGLPYQFSAITGASELGTGDVVNDMIPVGGSSDAAALMVLCQDAVLVLYGNSSADWNLVPLSRVSGAQRGTAQDAGGVIALDSPGVVRYPASQNFGNFAWDVASRKIGSIAAGATGVCSVFVPTLGLYRVWLQDGTALSGRVASQGQMEWTTIDYGRVISCAVSRELAGLQRTFVGGADGWVYETDVGRSFAGETIRSVARLNGLFQRRPDVLKQYRGCEIECEPGGAFVLLVSAEYSDNDVDEQVMEQTGVTQPGIGAQWDVSRWDASYWDTPRISRKRVDMGGQGASITITLASESNEELPHNLRTLTLQYTPLRTIIF